MTNISAWKEQISVILTFTGQLPCCDRISGPLLTSVDVEKWPRPWDDPGESIPFIGRLSYDVQVLHALCFSTGSAVRMVASIFTSHAAACIFSVSSFFHFLILIPLALCSSGLTHVACDFSSIVASTEGKNGKDVLKAYFFTSWVSVPRKKVPLNYLHNPLEGGTLSFIMSCSSWMLAFKCFLISSMFTENRM